MFWGSWQGKRLPACLPAWMAFQAHEANICRSVVVAAKLETCVCVRGLEKAKLAAVIRAESRGTAPNHDLIPPRMQTPPNALVGAKAVTFKNNNNKGFF